MHSMTQASMYAYTHNYTLTVISVIIEGYSFLKKSRGISLECSNGPKRYLSLKYNIKYLTQSLYVQILY